MSTLSTEGILGRWPSRQAVLEDARAANPALDLFAVHRWFQRGSVPPRYWRALAAGARQRDFTVTAEDFMDAHNAAGVALAASPQDLETYGSHDLAEDGERPHEPVMIERGAA